MSAVQTFALCIDCWEFHYGIADKNGVYSRDSGSSNHWDHAVHVFGRPTDYPPPIKAVLTSLAAGEPISNGRLEMFSLACAISAVQPTNGRKVAPPVIEQKHSRSQLAQIPASPEPEQDDLFGGVA